MTGLQPIRVRIAGYHAEGTVHSRALRDLEQRLVDTAAGLCLPQVTLNVVDQGVPTAQIAGLVARGDIDIAYISTISFVRYVAELAAFDLPFLVSSRQRAFAVLDRQLAPALAAAARAGMPVEVLAIWDNGVRQLSNGVRPIRSPQDCAGLVLRVQRSPLIRQGFELLGFQVVDMDIGRLGAAIRAGEVDAQENPLINMRGYGVDRLHRHISLTRHIHGVTLLICNPVAFAAWPMVLRDRIMAAVEATTPLQRRWAIEEDRAMAADMAGSGNVLTEVDDEAWAAFARRVEPLQAAHRDLLASPALAGLLD